MVVLYEQLKFKIKKSTVAKNNVNVTFLFDDKYFYCTYIAITSLINSKLPTTHLDINLIVCNISMLQRRLLENFENNDVNINIIDVDLTKYLEFSQVYHVTNTSLIKFDFANILKNIDKTLYIDGDVLINKDLSNLFNMDIDNFYIGACREYRAELRQYNKLLGTKYYINSGVMLLNLKKMRKENISERFYETKKVQPKSWQCQDQDVINYVCNGHIALLSPIYNFTLGIFVKENYNINELNNFYQTNFKSIKDMYDESAIIHYAGDLKPWSKTDLPSYVLKRYEYIDNHILINKNKKPSKFNLEAIFSIKNENIRKVFTIFGFKLKLKSKKLATIKRISDLENNVNLLKKKLKKQRKLINENTQAIINMQEQILQLSNKDNEIQNYLDNQILNLAKIQSDIHSIDKETLKISQTPNITEIAMLKT